MLKRSKVTEEMDRQNENITFPHMRAVNIYYIKITVYKNWLFACVHKSGEIRHENVLN